MSTCQSSSEGPPLHSLDEGDTLMGMAKAVLDPPSRRPAGSRQASASSPTLLPFESSSTAEVIEGEVIGIAPSFHQAQVETPDGRAYALTFRTPGISIDAVREGQRYRCLVTRRLAKVLRAELIA